MQPVAGEADAQRQAVRCRADPGLADVARRLDHAFRQTEAVGKIDEVRRRQHHDRERDVGERDLDGHFDGDQVFGLAHERAVESDDARHRRGNGRHAGRLDRLSRIHSPADAVVHEPAYDRRSSRERMTRSGGRSRYSSGLPVRLTQIVWKPNEDAPAMSQRFDERKATSFGIVPKLCPIRP